MDPTREASARGEPVLLTIDDGVATVTINRPEARNALNREVQYALRATLERLATNDTVQVVVITGSEGRVFVAGADLKQLKDYTKVDGLAGQLQGLFDTIEAFEKPTIAAINGYALGGGCELALACDLRVAVESARFGFPETGLSIIPGAGGTQRVTRLIGMAHALDLILTGRIVGATEALSIGLVSRIAPDGELLAQAGELAQTIRKKGPLATRLAKLTIRAGADTDMRTGQTIERLAQAILHESNDKQEGIAAQLEKRDARFKGL